MQIIALNGFLGARKGRVDITELLDKSLAQTPPCINYSVLRGRGGGGVRKFNQILRELKRAHKKHPVLVLMGKSYGGHWCVKLLEKLAESNHLNGYSKIGLLTVDPTYVLHKMQRVQRTIPNIDYAVNVHQYGLRSGYQLTPPAINLQVPATHSKIDAHPEVLKQVKAILKWGSSV